MYVSVYDLFVKNDVGKKKKKEDEVYFAFFVFWPHFFFCCKLVSVIDPVASLTRLAFGCTTCLGLCLLVQRVFFYL